MACKIKRSRAILHNSTPTSYVKNSAIASSSNRTGQFKDLQNVAATFQGCLLQGSKLVNVTRRYLEWFTTLCGESDYFATAQLQLL